MTLRRFTLVGIAAMLALAVSVACSQPAPAQTKGASGQVAAGRAAKPSGLQTAIFAGGCFWCTEADFEKVPGVVSAESGYTGGRTPRPTYETAGSGGHTEAVRVTYDPARISYRALVDHFWPTMDPTDLGGQFCDRGPTYRPAVFVTPGQRAAAEASRAAAARKLKSGTMKAPIVTATAFWPAEAYHQDYYKKNPLRYRTYRVGCGRDARLRAVWGG